MKAVRLFKFSSTVVKVARKRLYTSVLKPEILIHCKLKKEKRDQNYSAQESISMVSIRNKAAISKPRIQMDSEDFKRRHDAATLLKVGRKNTGRKTSSSTRVPKPPFFINMLR